MAAFVFLLFLFGAKGMVGVEPIASWFATSLEGGAAGEVASGGGARFGDLFKRGPLGATLLLFGTQGRDGRQRLLHWGRSFLPLWRLHRSRLPFVFGHYGPSVKLGSCGTSLVAPRLWVCPADQACWPTFILAFGRSVERANKAGDTGTWIGPDYFWGGGDAPLLKSVLPVLDGRR